MPDVTAPPDPAAPWRPRLRRLLYGGLALGLSVVALVRLLPFQTPFPLVALESLAFWTLMPAYVLGPIALVRGHRRIAAWLGVIVLVHLGWSFEWVPRQTDTDAAPLFRLLDANLLAPSPDAALARALLDQDADVLTLQEVSPEWVRVLDAEGATTAYPHRIAEPHPLDEDFLGIAIYSRVPFDHARIVDLEGAYAVPMAEADLTIEGQRVRIDSVHTMPPANAFAASIWQTQMDGLEARWRDDLRDEGRAFVAAGDFNASPFSFAHRRLLALGLAEAHESVGRGFALTWPNGMSSAPPMRLDHAYVHGLTVRGVRELPSMSSDHSPLVIDFGAPSSGPRRGLLHSE